MRGNEIDRPRGLLTLTASLTAFLFAVSLTGAAPASKPLFPIKDTGTEFPVLYEKYGEFSGRGTNNYRFTVKGKSRLAKAMGAGLYPSEPMILSQDPAYVRWRNRNKKPANHWDYVDSGDPQADFYVWANAQSVGPGTKLLFTGNALVAGGHIKHALKAYHAVLVHFPKEACWSADNTFVWYVGDEALSRIESLTSAHPEIGYRLQGAAFKVTNGNDTDLRNDRFVIDPGVWVARDNNGATDLKTAGIAQRRGLGSVRLVQYENKHWQLFVNDRAFFVRGMSYSPVPIGKQIQGYGNQWMFDDEDENGKADAPYDSYIDENNNGEQDPNEESVGDFELMRRMGVNAIRLYRTSNGSEYNPGEFNKDVLRDMHSRYGIYAVMGDFLGAYTIGSGATWEDGTDYTDPVQLERMRGLVKSYVEHHKGEPYVLMWLLGNENMMPSEYGGVNATRTNASEQIEAYLRFVNEIAEMIHVLDPNHPVAIGNLDLTQLDAHARFAPQVDIYGANSYRGNMGFGSLWSKVRHQFDRPVLITEYGCDAFDSRTNRENEKAQAGYHENAWKDIYLHRGGGPEEGNAIGGLIYEFVDEWWKSHSGSWDQHDAIKDSPMAFPDSWSSEEYLGVMSQGKGTHSPFLRRPRQTYNIYRDKLWK